MVRIQNNLPHKSPQKRLPHMNLPMLERVRSLDFIMAWLLPQTRIKRLRTLDKQESACYSHRVNKGTAHSDAQTTTKDPTQ